jgi:hypothetical protein
MSETKQLRIESHEPDPQARGATSLVVVDDDGHRWEFHGLQFPPTVDPLAWAIEQVNAMPLRDREINCTHCEATGEPAIVADPNGGDD